MGTCVIRIHGGHRLPYGLESPDLYFLPGYGRAASIADGGEWVLLEAFDGAWQVPLILRKLDGGAKDAISPYGYSGVYAATNLSSAQIQDAWSATVTCLQDLGVISALLRHSPLVPQASDLPGLRSIIDGHPTIVLEPTDGDSSWSGMESSCRTWTRKALKHGYVGDVREVEPQDLASTGDFRRLYEQTMQRRSAAALYFFGDDYYAALLDGLGGNVFIAEVRNGDGVAVSSTLLMRHAHRLHYHLSGSNLQDARMGSNNLMLWTATEFAVAGGIREFHLGGGLDARDGLFKFKRSFGGRELEYRVSGLVIDNDLYAAHTKSRAEACHTTPEALLTSSYFPAYRGGAPVV